MRHRRRGAGRPRSTPDLESPLLMAIRDEIERRGVGAASRLAGRLGWSPQRVSNYFCGYRVPGVDDLEAMASALGLAFVAVARRKR